MSHIWAQKIILGLAKYKELTQIPFNFCNVLCLNFILNVTHKSFKPIDLIHKTITQTLLELQIVLNRPNL